MGPRHEADDGIEQPDDHEPDEHGQQQTEQDQCKQRKGRLVHEVLGEQVFDERKPG